MKFEVFMAKNKRTVGSVEAQGHYRAVPQYLFWKQCCHT
jgi:hypothetical protein